uniref:Phosphoribosyl-ATP diphosphatase n=1 Tax=Quercus lobata TaxID=97700 RepID=A0A7N2QZK4_QUELO
MADVLYHAMVLLANKDVKIEDVMQVLRQRFSQSRKREVEYLKARYGLYRLLRLYIFTFILQLPLPSVSGMLVQLVKHVLPFVAHESRHCIIPRKSFPFDKQSVRHLNTSCSHKLLHSASEFGFEASSWATPKYTSNSTARTGTIDLAVKPMIRYYPVN